MSEVGKNKGKLSQISFGCLCLLPFNSSLSEIIQGGGTLLKAVKILPVFGFSSPFQSLSRKEFIPNIHPEPPLAQKNPLMGKIPWNWELRGVSVPREVLPPEMGWDWQYLGSGIEQGVQL